MMSKRSEIYPLTSLRFFAAALVFIQHLQMIPGLEWLGSKSAFLGKIGVSVFFILSGFILTYAHGAQNWTAEFGKNTREFYWSRFARIYPLHWLLFLMALPLGLNSHTARVTIADFPWLLTLTNGMWPGFATGPQPDKAAWTLSVEFLFYFLTPLFFWILSRRKNPLAILGAIIPLYILIITSLMLLFPNWNWVAYCRLPEFLLGISGFYLLKKVNLSRIAPHLFLLGVALLTAAAIGDNLFKWRFYFFSYASGSLLVILSCASFTGAIRTFFSKPAFVLLGNASFALYLLQDPVLRYAKVFFNRLGIVFPTFGGILVGLILFTATVAASIIFYKFYENPVRLKLRSVLKHTNTPSAAKKSKVADVKRVEI